MQKTEVHVARQPIFDVNLNVFGYELLFRSDFIDHYNGTDGDQATRNVIANSFLLIGMGALTNGKRAFINFTANSITNNIASILPPHLVAVELLENIIPNQEIINACKKLKQEHYLLVLDDFVFAPEYVPLIELADIIKVDFRNTPREERCRLVRRLKDYPVKFLAEKVETYEEFQDALQMGFSYFQGYFFCKPFIMSGKNLPGYKANYFRILQEINQPDLEFRQIENILRKDISLTYKLMKFINSSIFGFRNKISSLRQALTLIGQKELTQWVSLIALQGIGEHKPGQLVLESLIRARFAENLAAGKMPKSQIGNAFLMGMFSHIDALLDRPLIEILNEISLDKDIKHALLGIGHNQFFILYKLIQTYERGDWEANTAYAEEMGISEHDILRSYRESLKWAHDLLMCNY